MKKIIKFNIFLTLSIFLASLIKPAQAEVINSSALDRLKGVAGAGGYNTTTDGPTLPVIIGIIINGFSSLLGIIFVILIVYSGYTWMTSSGNEEKIKKAVSTIRSSVIGLIVTLSAWSLWTFIFQKLVS